MAVEKVQGAPTTRISVQQRAEVVQPSGDDREIRIILGSTVYLQFEEREIKDEEGKKKKETKRKKGDTVVSLFHKILIYGFNITLFSYTIFIIV